MQLIQGAWPPQRLGDVLFDRGAGGAAPAGAVAGGGGMKSSLVFRDQVAAMGSWFELWNPCEQTVGLYSLLRRLGPTQARFLALVLDRSLADCTELRQRERHANDPAYIERLAREPRDQALGQLLGLLPLLAPGNQAAKAAYLNLIPQVLAHALDCRPLVEGARQLLSYSLIHPAISSRDDRRLLTLWLRHLEDRISTSRYQEHGGSGAESLNGTGGLDDGGGSLAAGRPSAGLDSWPAVDGLGSLNGHHHHPYGGDLNGFGLAPLVTGGGSLPPGLDSSHMALHPSNLSTFAPAGQSLSQPMLKRSSSLTPPCSTSSLHQPQMPQAQQGFGRLLGSHSASVDWRCGPPPGPPPHEAEAVGPPLSPQSSGASSGSEGHGAEDQAQPGFNLDGSGMKDVPSWLKSLRLHKYAYLFANMSYEEMMNLTEEKLEAQSVTKGARHKIVLSIRKLKERPATLRQLEKSLQEEGDIRTALVELRAMLQTPMKASSRAEDGQDGAVPPHRSASPSSSSSVASAAHPSGGGGDNDIGSGSATTSSSVVTEEEERRAEEEESSPPSSLDSACGGGGSRSPSKGGPTAVDAAAEEDEDLPGLFTRVVGKVCSSLLVSVRAEDQSVGQFVTLVDKCLAHEAFSPAQKRRLFSWRQQVHKAWHPVPPRRSIDARHHHHHHSPASSAAVAAAAVAQGPRPPPAGRWCSVGSSVLPPLVGGSDFCRLAGPNGPPPAPAPLGRPPAVFFGTAGAGGSVDCPGGSNGGPLGGPLAMVIKRPSLQEIQRTHSAPVRPNPVVASLYKQAAANSGACSGRMQADASANDPDINNRLESLCLSVTEHALGGSDGMPPF
ncbi:sterile alpha motif domain containing protein 4 smaug isoform X2 [Amblyomma americanum]